MTEKNKLQSILCDLSSLLLCKWNENFMLMLRNTIRSHCIRKKGLMAFSNTVHIVHSFQLCFAYVSEWVKEDMDQRMRSSKRRRRRTKEWIKKILKNLKREFRHVNLLRHTQKLTIYMGEYLRHSFFECRNTDDQRFIIIHRHHD